jgi:regulator of cell morphogenesis and NO signaling
VAEVHGLHHPELLEVKYLLTEINDELSAHMVKEEKILFPYIKELVHLNKDDLARHVVRFTSVQGPISMMEMEHEIVGKNFERIREQTNNYSLPEDACASYTLLFKMLAEFEEDLHLHIHLENNILFPKALEIEKS